MIATFTYNFPCSTLARLCFVLIQRIDRRPKILLGRYLKRNYFICENNRRDSGLKIIKIKIDISNPITPSNLFGIARKIECHD